jgi:hypothetical protein
MTARNTLAEIMIFIFLINVKEMKKHSRAACELAAV